MVTTTPARGPKALTVARYQARLAGVNDPQPGAAQAQENEVDVQRSRLAKAIARLVMRAYRAKHPEAGAPERERGVKRAA